MLLIEKMFPEPPQSPGAPMKPIPKWVPTATIRKNMDKRLPMMRKAMGGDSRDVTTRPILMQDHIIDGYAAKIRVRRYFPEGDPRPRQAQLFLHGGGFFGGTIFAVEEYCKGLADRADCVVLSVEYHLAPEHPFPEGLMDCHSALLWAWHHADALGIDQARFSVSGDSAGGNFAAALCLMARDQGEIKLCAQILLYPLTDFVAPASPAGSGMDRASAVIYGWYLKDFKDLSDPRVSPVRAKHLGGLPRAMVVICEQDGLKDQGRAYAQALSDAGVESALVLYKNTPHAFIDNTGTTEQGLDLIREVVRFLQV